MHKCTLKIAAPYVLSHQDSCDKSFSSHSVSKKDIELKMSQSSMLAAGIRMLVDCACLGETVRPDPAAMSAKASPENIKTGKSIISGM